MKCDAADIRWKQMKNAEEPQLLVLVDLGSQQVFLSPHIPSQPGEGVHRQADGCVLEAGHIWVPSLVSQVTCCVIMAGWLAS